MKFPPYSLSVLLCLTPLVTGQEHQEAGSQSPESAAAASPDTPEGAGDLPADAVTEAAAAGEEGEEVGTGIAVGEDPADPAPVGEAEEAEEKRQVVMPPALSPVKLPSPPGVSALGDESEVGKTVASLLAENRTREALAAATEAAEAGSLDGEFLLAWLAAGGRGTPDQQPQLVEAEKRYRKAHQAGHTPSSLNLAILLLQEGDEEKKSEGTDILRELAQDDPKEAGFWYGAACAFGAGVPADFASAVEFWRRAAEAGKDEALLHLGLAYTGAFGFPARQDHEEAAKVWQRGAEAGQARCALHLAYLLLGANPPAAVPTDQAASLLKQASGAYLPEATFMLAEVTRFGEFGIAEADPASAMGLYHLAAEANHLGAMMRLATALEEGEEGIPQDLPGALSLIRKAAGLGVPEALYRLAAIARTGTHGMERDPSLAARAYLSAALAGHAKSAGELGEAYRQGKLGLLPDLVAARTWLTQACEANDPKGCTGLAEMMLAGQIPGAQLETIQQHLVKGALGQQARAGFLLGRLLESGRLGQANRVAALAWYRWAGALGDVDAKARATGLLQKVSPEELEASDRALAELRQQYGGE